MDVSNSLAEGVAVIFWIGGRWLGGNLLEISCQHLRKCPIRSPQLLSICLNSLSPHSIAQVNNHFGHNWLHMWFGVNRLPNHMIMIKEKSVNVDSNFMTSKA